MSIQVTLYDEGIKDIRLAIERLALRYKKYTKKNPGKANLVIVFQRGPITMSNGEWSKMPVKDLTMDPNKVLGYFKRSNLNWGILGYGDTKGGLKELMKFAKTKLNPKQLLGENQDLNMTIKPPQLLKKGDQVYGKIVIVVPDKSLEGEDIKSNVLEKYGYVGINSWKKKASSLLEENELDSRISEIINNEAKLTSIIKPYVDPNVETEEEKEESDNKAIIKENTDDVTQALVKLGFTKSLIRRTLKQIDMSKKSDVIIKEALRILNKEGNTKGKL